MPKLNDKADAIVKTVAVDVVSLASYTSQALELATFLTNTPCKTAEAEAWFSSQLSTVRALLKRLDDQRTSLTKPLLEAKRKVDGMFSPAVNPLKDCESIIRGKLAGAALGRLERERAALQLAQEAAATGDTDAVMAALAEAPEAVTTTGSSYSVVWHARVVDKAAVPERFKLVDMDELEVFAKAHGKEKPAAVDGVEWVESVKVRAK